MTQHNVKDKVKPFKQGSAEWHAARSKGIGGSDMAAIMGLNPWKTPYQVWLEKTGRASGNIESEKMTIGKEIEDFIASQYTRLFGRKTRRVNKFKTCDQYPFIGGSVDRVFQDEQHGTGILEFKNVSAESFRNTFAGGVPDYYFIQVQTYMLVFKATVADLFVFVGGERFENFRITRNEDVIDAIIKSAKIFWFDHVQMDSPPPVSSKDDLKLKYPAQDFKPETVIPADLDIIAKVEELAKIKKHIKQLESEKETLELAVMDHLGANEALADWHGNILATWKYGLRTAFDSKAFKESDPATYKKFEKTTETRTFLLKVK